MPMPTVMKRLGKLCQIGGAVFLAIGLGFAGTLLVKRPSGYHRRDLNCNNNLDQISMAFKTWALDHHEQYPFNLSTNFGGTLEFCDRDKDGFDRNAFAHFRVMSNELLNPSLLICPNDHERKPATDFEHLRPENISYRLRSGTNVNDSSMTEVLAVCVADSNLVRCSGETRLWNEGKNPRLSLADMWEDTGIRELIELAICLSAIGGLFLGTGTFFVRQAKQKSEQEPDLAK
jgi:hypothetical protein